MDHYWQSVTSILDEVDRLKVGASEASLDCTQTVASVFVYMSFLLLICTLFASMGLSTCAGIVALFFILLSSPSAILAPTTHPKNSKRLPGIALSMGHDTIDLSTNPRVPPNQGCDVQLTDRTNAFRAAAVRNMMESSKSVGLRVDLKHRTAHPSQRDTSFKDSLVQSLTRDIARTQRISRRVGYASILTSSLDLEVRKAAAVEHEPHLNEKVKKSMQFGGMVESGASIGSGEYFMDIFIGTPARHIPVILDTGSDLTWVQCEPCHHCYTQEGPVFEPQRSDSYQHVDCVSPDCTLVNPFYNSSTCGSDKGRGCQYFYWYGDLSNTTGDLAQETFTLNVSKGEALRIEKVLFGCGHNNEGLFHGAGGLLGLGQGDISFASQVGSIYGDKFSYCLVDRDNPLTVSSTIIFGEDDILPTLHQFQLTPLLKNPFINTFYYVNISHLVVEGVNLSIPSSTWQIRPDGGGGTIVDSGTTLTYFTEPAYQALRNAVDSRIPLPKATPVDPLDLCYNTTGVVNPRFPTFSISFVNGAVWKLPQKNVFIRPDPDEEIMCLAILGCPVETLHIIGNYQQQNFHMVFDRSNAQLGFAPMQCASL